MRQEIPYIHVVRTVACIMVLCLHSLPTFKVIGIDQYFYELVRLATRPCVPIWIKKLAIQTDCFLYKIIKKISCLSFGIYLSHMVIYRVLTMHLYQISISVLMQIAVMGFTFVGAFFLTLLLSKISYSRYIVGI